MRKTVFISSTFEDLQTHRRKIWDLLETYDVNVRGMEQFGARKEAPLLTCISEVEQSDIFVCIVGFRLGSIDKSTGKSFTQREYERAYELNREILIYLIDEKDSVIPFKNIDLGEKAEKLSSFKSILKERHTVDTFISENDLSAKLKRKFDQIFSSKLIQAEAPTDELLNSKLTIEKFHLLPKLYSGREVKLKLEFEGEPFPASKAICSNFNLEYGKTLGVNIKIIEPILKENSIKHIFIDEKNSEDFFSLPRKNNVAVYAKLEFADSTIAQVKANFVEKFYSSFALPLMPNLATNLVTTKVIEAEGTIIARLVRIEK